MFSNHFFPEEKTEIFNNLHEKIISNRLTGNIFILARQQQEQQKNIKTFFPKRKNFWRKEKKKNLSIQRTRRRKITLSSSSSRERERKKEKKKNPENWKDCQK